MARKFNPMRGKAGGQGKRGYAVRSSEFGRVVRRDKGTGGKVTVLGPQGNRVGQSRKRKAR